MHVLNDDVLDTYAHDMVSLIIVEETLMQLELCRENTRR
jgi:hypothetical protein